MNAGEVPLRPIEDWAPEDVLVSRPQMRVSVSRLPVGAGVFIEHLAAAATSLTRWKPPRPWPPVSTS